MRPFDITCDCNWFDLFLFMEGMVSEPEGQVPTQRALGADAARLGL